MSLSAPSVNEKYSEGEESPQVIKQPYNLRWLTVTVTFVVVITLIASIVVAALYVPEVAVYIPIIAIGLALALQKYIASFFAYFYINFTRIYDLGDRIRLGNIKGDVRRVGLLHTTLEEVGEDEKLGGELTGRLLHVPNLVILDQPVLNYSKDYSIRDETLSSDYMFDEVRIPITTDSDAEAASELLDNILKKQDKACIREARKTFRKDYPKFLKEAISGSRVQVYIEPTHIWIKGKFVAPLRGRNALRSKILLQFLKEVSGRPDIKLA
ncbi:MAG: mechanosensitive ion channel [Dehalococcoidia bacterium]|nr:mechanosensitive ion channel [Dehalococcoidia bacterium]